MFKMFVTAEKQQRFKYLISPTSIRFELSSIRDEKSFLSNFHIADYFFFQLRVTMVSLNSAATSVMVVGSSTSQHSMCIF